MFMLSGASSTSFSGPALRRSKSLPRLASHPFEPAEVKTVRNSISRPYPDARRPKVFRSAGGKLARAEAKGPYLDKIHKKFPLGGWLESTIQGDPENVQLLESMHPGIRRYTKEQEWEKYNKLVQSHPKLLAEMAKKRNELHAVPNYASSSRFMKPKEQKFLTQAMQAIQKDVEENPFHMHGESGVSGNRAGKVTWFGHSPERSISMELTPGDAYALHSHPPYQEPFTSCASEEDHKAAANSYLLFLAKEYVTNGKDVLQIQPDSLRLVQLHPDPELEQKLGKFPEAFRLPDPQKPPRPFSNHEAPPAFPERWQPPAGWTPPADYPRAQPARGEGEPSTSRKRPRPH
jgi:hypothetical protein